MKNAKNAFRRGYRFTSFRGAATAVCAQALPGADVTVPLQPGYGLPATPIVKAGDSVRLGTIIAESEGPGSPVHAPVTGQIGRIRKDSIEIGIDESGSIDEFVPTPDAASIMSPRINTGL